MKRNFTWFIMAILSLLTPVVRSAELPGLAVWTIRSGEGPAHAARIEQEITQALKSSGSLHVMTPSRRNELMAEPGAPDRGCVTNECLSQAARLLKVDWLIIGDVGKTGANYMLNLLLIEASTGHAVGVFSKETPASALSRTVAEGAAKLVSQIPGAGSSDQVIETSGPSGTVIVRTKPNGAQAYIDAYLIGRTPTAAYRVPVGTHQVTLILDGHDIVQTEVKVRQSETATVNEVLIMRTGAIEVDSNPSGATIYLDGRAQGKTPGKLDGLLVGIHRLRFEMEGFQPLETTVTIDENQSQKRIFQLNRKGVMVLVTSQPEGAQVLVDGRPVGSSLYVGPLEPGKHTLVVQLGGYGRQTKEIEIEAGRSYAFHFRMTHGAEAAPAATALPVRTPGITAPPPPPSNYQGGNPEARKHYDQASASNNIEERIRLYQQAIAADSHFAPAHNDLGVDYAELNRWDDAIREYRAALTIDPNYSYAHNNLGNAYLNTGRTDEAIAELKIALRINPGYGTAHFNLGKAYFTQEKFEDALKEFQAAATSDPKNASAYFNMGRTLKRLNDLDKAILMYQRCLELDPEYIDVYFNLADLYDAKGDRKAAVYYYSKYILEENRPGETEWIEKAKQRLRELGGE